MRQKATFFVTLGAFFVLSACGRNGYKKAEADVETLNGTFTVGAASGASSDFERLEYREYLIDHGRVSLRTMNEDLVMTDEENAFEVEAIGEIKKIGGSAYELIPIGGLTQRAAAKPELKPYLAHFDNNGRIKMIVDKNRLAFTTSAGRSWVWTRVNGAESARRKVSTSMKTMLKKKIDLLQKYAGHDLILQYRLIQDPPKARPKQVTAPSRDRRGNAKLTVDDLPHADSALEDGASVTLTPSASARVEAANIKEEETDSVNSKLINVNAKTLRLGDDKTALVNGKLTAQLSFLMSKNTSCMGDKKDQCLFIQVFLPSEDKTRNPSVINGAFEDGTLEARIFRRVKTNNGDKLYTDVYALKAAPVAAPTPGGKTDAALDGKKDPPPSIETPPKEQTGTPEVKPGSPQPESPKPEGAAPANAEPAKDGPPAAAPAAPELTASPKGDTASPDQETAETPAAASK